MTPFEIENQIYDYLSADGLIMIGNDSVQIVWQNQIVKRPQVPRIAVGRTNDSNRPLGLSTSSVLTSSLVLTVVTEFGDYSEDRNRILRSMYRNFPLQKEIGGAIITRPPEVRVGYRDKSEYRTPVFIQYTAILETEM